jgi:uncharacterized protein YacL
MALWVLRAAFILVAAGVAITLVNSQPDTTPAWKWGTFLTVMGAAVAFIIGDMLVPRKRIDVISCVYFGIIVGLVLTQMVMVAIDPLLVGSLEIKPSIQLTLAVALCYTCISLLLQTKDDFRFVIPYVEFAKEVKGMKPYILDTSVVIDGRIADVVQTNLFDNQILMPRFVLNELQAIADSSDKLRRSRGRRGLDILNRLRNDAHVDLKIYDRNVPELQGQPVDMKLVLLAKNLDGKLVTGDFNLNKVARLHNVPVINFNDLANALKPVFLPGEELTVTIVKPGEGPLQGVGYLDDGTMIVVEGGRDHVNDTVKVSVTSVLQTSAGRMIFGKYEARA